jgi:hypothetical protein
MKTIHNLNNPKNRLTGALAVLLLALLVACGGGEAAPEATAVEAAPTVAEAPTEAATVAPPTEAAPTDAPTAAPEAATPTVDPTAEAQAAGPDGPVVMVGDCGNAFYPVAEGRSLTYSSNFEALGSVEYTTTFSDVTESSFTITTDVGEGEVVAVTWTCTGEGMLSPEFSQMPGGIEGMSIEFVEATGVSIPTEEMFEPGQSWTTHYVANATMPDVGAGEMTMVQTMDMTNTVAGIESVTVPAGEFPDAVRVDTTGTISIALSMAGTPQPGSTIEMTYTTWYVRDIGMVRQDLSSLLGEGGTGGSVTELLSIQ